MRNEERGRELGLEKKLMQDSYQNSLERMLFNEFNSRAFNDTIGMVRKFPIRIGSVSQLETLGNSSR